MRFHRLILLSATVFASGVPVLAAEQVLDARLHHLRAGDEREWSEFPLQAEGPRLSLKFRAAANAGEATLRVRQQDVKQTWKVLLNGKELGRLRNDENDMVIYLPVPPGTLADGDNELTVEPASVRSADDVRVGEIALDNRPPGEVLGESTVELRVLDATDAAKPVPVPCRVTVLDAAGALRTVGADPAMRSREEAGGARERDRLAVRPGVIYTGDGRAKFGLPAGEYTIYAGRGFEYGIDKVKVSLKPGDVVRKKLAIRREVPTPGYVACDPHVHSLTYSGHGDATIGERVLAIAGEGVELPVAAEHNLHADYHPAAVRHDVRRFFTPVVGNEVTTPVGHFNIFPVSTDAPVPEHRAGEWKPIFESIAARTGAGVIILNHPRDLHSGFRPFGPEHHNAATGENLDGWELRAGAMEVVNSGAQQSDVLLPFRDWFALLNRGVFLTPVGASDSHDVARFIVGQARTYVRCNDGDPGAIDVKEAVASFRAGRVLVSCGLLAEITVNGEHGPGDLVPPSEEVRVAVRVLGPGWVRAEKVELYANGRKIREAEIANGDRPGVKWEGEWKLPRFRHDIHLAAIATGPGVKELYWPIAKPYQPGSPEVRRRVIGSTGAVWIDADGDGGRTSAFAYARRFNQQHGKDTAALIRALAGYDGAVATQAAGLLQARGVSVQDPEVRAAAAKAGGQVARGFQAFFEAWRESEIARSRAR